MFDGLHRRLHAVDSDLRRHHIIAAYSFFAPFKTGQVSLGQAGFMAVGAYASAMLTQKFGLPFAAALPFAGLSRA